MAPESLHLIACARLSDTLDVAKTKQSIRKEGASAGKEKKAAPRFSYLYTSLPDYLGAWNRLLILQLPVQREWIYFCLFNHFFIQLFVYLYLKLQIN